MSIRKTVALIKRHENVKVITNNRDKLKDYKEYEYSLKDIVINNNDNVEIILNNEVIEIPVNKIIVTIGVRKIVFYTHLQIISFNY